MKLRTLYILLFICAQPFLALSQSAEGSFHMAGNQYIHEKMREAKLTLENALRKYPNDPKLQALYGKIKKEQDEKEKQDQEQKDQQNQDQQNKEQKDKEQKDKENQQNKKEKEDAEKKKQDEKKEREKQQQEQESKKDEQQKNQNLDREKLKQMKISEEKAKMILEAMKNQEKQYLQQNKRKAIKSRDRSKPDW